MFILLDLILNIKKFGVLIILLRVLLTVNLNPQIMYIITKVIYNSNTNARVAIVDRNEIICSKEELITLILPKLKRLCEACNLEYRRINSDKRVKFEVVEVADRAIEDYIKGIDDSIINTIRGYNTHIVNANLILKRANKKYSKPLSAGVKPLVVANDYLKPYLTKQEYDLIDNVIHVKES